MYLAEFKYVLKIVTLSNTKAVVVTIFSNTLLPLYKLSMSVKCARLVVSMSTSYVVLHVTFVHKHVHMLVQGLA